MIDWVEAHIEFVLVLLSMTTTGASAIMTAIVKRRDRLLKQRTENADMRMRGIVDAALRDHESVEEGMYTRLSSRLEAFDARLDTISDEVARLGGYVEALVMGNGNLRNRFRRSSDETRNPDDDDRQNS